jgi:hypothetical protein
LLELANYKGREQLLSALLIVVFTSRTTSTRYPQAFYVLFMLGVGEEEEEQRTENIEGKVLSFLYVLMLFPRLSRATDVT